MTYQAKDLGFVGDAYAAPMQLQSAQTLINWYLETAESKGVKMPIAMLSTPGLSELLDLGSGEVRGMWVLPGDATALVVVGSAVYLVSVTNAATATSPPTFTANQVGSLNTIAGPVVIRDNGAAFGGEGGFAVIVDGQFGYYYNLSGEASAVTFTGDLFTNSMSIQNIGAIPNGIVVTPGATIADTAGAIPAGTRFVGADFNNVFINMSSFPTSAETGDEFSIIVPAFGQITDPAWLPASRVDFIEGWLIFNQVNTRTFFTNAATPYTLLFDGAFYALKDSSTDNLVTLYANQRELWLIGSRTTEVWFNAGQANFAFARVQGVGPQIGCSAQHSITRVGPQLVWLARNEQGQNMVVTGNEYSWDRLSTHAIEDIIATYTVVDDAIGYGYQEDGHWFYMLIFPTANATWCYDLTAKMWHQRASWQNNEWARHRSNCFMNFQDVRVVGDYSTGQLYAFSRKTYTDNGTPIRRQRRTGPVWSGTDRKRLFHSWLQVEFTPSAGLSGKQYGVNPQAMLRWSNDGAYTWSNEHWQSMGRIGQTRRRCIWRRLGQARDRVYELNFIDPVPCDIIGATLFFENETPEEDEARG